MRALAFVMLLASMAAQPSAAQEGVPPVESLAWDLERAFVEMERLRAEIAVLKGIAPAQAALLAWNRERAETLGPDGVPGSAVLSPRLCAEPELAPWCSVLPVTFGAGAAETADNRHGKDGER